MTDEQTCDVNECPRKWSTLIPIDRLPPKLDTLFEDRRGKLEPYDFVRLCPQHYGHLRNHHGIELGYKFIRGKTRAFIKEASF